MLHGLLHQRHAPLLRVALMAALCCFPAPQLQVRISACLQVKGTAAPLFSHALYFHSLAPAGTQVCFCLSCQGRA